MRRGVGIAAAKNKSLAQVTGKDNFNTIGVLKWSLVTCFVLNKMVPYYCFGLSSTYLYIARKIYLLILRRFFSWKNSQEWNRFHTEMLTSFLHLEINWNTRDIHVYPWKYLTQFLNFIIRIVSSCLHCKIPDHIDFLLLTMYWNLHDKLHVQGVFQNRNLGFFVHSIKWTLFKPWGVYNIK